MSFIRSSQHSLKFCNVQKESDIRQLVAEYRSLVQAIIDHVWVHGYRDFSVQKNRLDCLSLLDSAFLKQFGSSYTERLKQAAGKQAMAMISAATEKRRKQLYVLREAQKNREDRKSLQRKISLFPLVKPDASSINLELDSRFIDFKFDKQNKFMCFVRLTSFKKGRVISIPVSHSPVFDKWSAAGTLKKAIRLSSKSITLLFEVAEPAKTETGSVVGCDQGITDPVMLSDGQQPPLYQGKYSLADVQKRLSRKQKGSLAFKRTQDFRKNLINWSINQLNFDGVKELRLEKLFQVGVGKRKSRFLSHWTYTVINGKLARVAQEKGFLLREVSNEFRSQRCSCCGWVRKANRKGKTFLCDKCGNALDADLNAASNLRLDLAEIPFWVRLSRINRRGFYWRPDGLFSECQEPIVPDAPKE